jgi:hypothetical protein
MTRRGSGMGPELVGGGPPEFELVLIDGDNLLHRVRGMRDEAGLRWLLPRLRAWLPQGSRALVMLDGQPDPGESLRRRVATGVEFQHSGSVDADTRLVQTLAARPYAERARTVVVTDDRQLGDRVRQAGGLVRRLDWLTAGLAAAVGEPAVVGGAPRDPSRRPWVARALLAGQGIAAPPRRPGSGRRPSDAGGEGGSVPESGHARRAGKGSVAESDRGIVTEGIRPVGIGRGKAPRSSGSPEEPPSGGSGHGAGGGRAQGAAEDGAGDDEREPWKPGRGATRKRGNPKRGS